MKKRLDKFVDVTMLQCCNKSCMSAHEHYKYYSNLKFKQIIVDTYHLQVVSLNRRWAILVHRDSASDKLARIQSSSRHLIAHNYYFPDMKISFE